MADAQLTQLELGGEGQEDGADAGDGLEQEALL